MRKKIIITTILSVFLSLILLLGISVAIVRNAQRRDAEKSLKNFLAVAESYYDPDYQSYTPAEAFSPENTKKLLANSYSDVRLSIIASDGTMIIDTLSETTENHLNRPEIKNPGVIYYRWSDTLKENMIYLAGIDVGSQAKQSDYVRVALSMAAVEKTTSQLAAYGFLGTIGITLLSALVAFYLTNQSLKPLREEVRSLSESVDEGTGSDDDVKELGERIAKAKLLLGERYDAIEKEKKKYEDLLDGMEQGLLAFDATGRIQIANRAAAEAFLARKEDLLGVHYSALSTDENFLKALSDAFKADQPSHFDFTQGGRTYLINLSPLGINGDKPGDSHGVSLLTLDVSDKRKLEATKRDFFANASHELKSPLTSIIGYQELLANGTIVGTEEEQRAYAATLKAARRMKDIIAEMLVLSKLESGLPKAKTPLDIKALILSILEEKDEAIHQRNIQVKTDLQDVTLLMEKEDAHNLFANLIGNAISYNKEGGSITLSLTPSTFVISDTGIGIPLDKQSRIYERFYQVDPSRSKEVGGTGLGLSIVKHIVLDYSFDLALVSQVNIGSTFTLKFTKE
jgi:two-component system, OmpR family, phosphate regulon sensor histidine kinase PhoR